MFGIRFATRINHTGFVYNPCRPATMAQSFDQIQRVMAALSAMKVLRASVGYIFETLASGVRPDEAKYLLELQEQLNAVTVNLRDVESTIGGLHPPQGVLSLGNTSFLSQETTLDRQSLYPALVNTYKWIEKVNGHSQMASTLLNANILKRSYNNSSSKRRRRSPNYSPAAVDQCLSQFDRSPSEIQMRIWRPFGSNAVLHVTLGRIMKVALIFKGLITEWVVVKGFNEPLDDVDDLWTESRYKVLKRVRDHMHSAMLHFFSPALPELAVRSVLTWINSYLTLYSDPCKKCGKLLHNSMPPTWRDFRSLEPFHDECRH